MVPVVQERPCGAPSRSRHSSSGMVCFPTGFPTVFFQDGLLFMFRKSSFQCRVPICLLLKCFSQSFPSSFFAEFLQVFS